jgi:hypothetical protein
VVSAQSSKWKPEASASLDQPGGPLRIVEVFPVLRVAGQYDEILNAGRVTGELRADVTAEDIAASLIGIFTVAHPPEHHARASRLLNILMDGLRPAP